MDIAVDIAEPPTAPEYPLDDTLRLNHIQARGTHNSTHVEPEGNGVPDWDYTHVPLDQQLEFQGVRQVELDIHVNPEGGFRVFHVPVIDEETTCGELLECLQLIRDWSDAHSGHHLLAILIEPKDEFDVLKIDDYDALHAALYAVWPAERVLRPDDVRGAHSTLREALETDGWPTLGQTRNRVMFVMLDEGEHRAAYLEKYPGLSEAAIFMRGGLGQPWGAVIETGNTDEITAAVEAGYLVRTAANDEDAAQHRLAAGAHWISTDFPAPVPNRPFWLELPNGTPSRCNPVAAPTPCGSSDIEALTP